MRLSLLALGLSLLATAAAAEVGDLSADPIAAETAATLPHKGASKAAVLKDFGQPLLRHPAAGGDTPKHPPITRWDYDAFSVFFEYDHVVDAVQKDHPAPIKVQSGLERASQP